MISQKEILIVGFARSGLAAAKLLSKSNKVVVSDPNVDLNSPEVNALKEQGVIFDLSQDRAIYDEYNFNLVVKSPGIPLSNPFLFAAKSKGIEIVNEIEVAYQYTNGAKIVALTGSNGKTTTTLLTYNILNNYFDDVRLGGNIGIPFCEIVENATKDTIFVIELSSFQLETIKEFKPDIACLLNFSQAHLDYHNTYEKYVEAKGNIFMNMDYDDMLIINQDDFEVVTLAHTSMSDIESISVKAKLTDQGAYLNNGKLFYKEEKIIDIKDMVLKGNHNYANALFAINVAKLLGVDNKSINQVLTTFSGAEHRLEFLGEIKGIKIYNDSKATNVESATVALKSFNTPVIYLAGGYDREMDFTLLQEVKSQVKRAYLFGQVGDKMAQVIPGQVYETFDQAVTSALQEAQAGDTILLSPANASFDEFDSFESRGKRFKELVDNFRGQ